MILKYEKGCLSWVDESCQRWCHLCTVLYYYRLILFQNCLQKGTQSVWCPPKVNKQVNYLHFETKKGLIITFTFSVIRQQFLMCFRKIINAFLFTEKGKYFESSICTFPILACFYKWLLEEEEKRILLSSLFIESWMKLIKCIQDMFQLFHSLCWQTPLCFALQRYWIIKQNIHQI